MNFKVITHVALCLAVSGSLCWATPTHQPKKGTHALHHNEWYLRGKALIKALYESNQVETNEAKKHLRYFAQLVLDKPTSSSSIRAFRALQNLVRGMKDELPLLPAPTNTKEALLQKLDPVFSIIIASSNYAGACKALGAYITHLAELPETKAKLSDATWLLSGIENDHTFATDGASNDASHRAHLLGLHCEEVLRRSLPTNLFEKLFYTFPTTEVQEIQALLTDMKEHGDYRYISIITSSFKDGFNSFDIGFKNNQAELTQQLASQIINLLCDVVIEMLTTEESGTGPIARMGEALVAYAQSISAL